MMIDYTLTFSFDFVDYAERALAKFALDLIVQESAATAGGGSGWGRTLLSHYF